VSLWIDNVRVERATPTLPDRWGFSRAVALPVQASSTSVSLQRIGDVYLASHRTTPFRGSFNATPGGVRRVLGGAQPHPGWLASDAGQLVRVGKVNPDTGAWGRTGTIAAVTYDHDNLTAQVSLDENRQGFDTLLARLAVVTSQRRT
jgi:hypothetical protein